MVVRMLQLLNAHHERQDLSQVLDIAVVYRDPCAHQAGRRQRPGERHCILVCSSSRPLWRPSRLEQTRGKATVLTKLCSAR